MNHKVYKTIELTGTSPTSIEEAVNLALQRAGETIHHLCWFEVIETRGCVENNQVKTWQVTLKIGFGVDDVSK